MASGKSSMRGSRVGAGPMGEAERGETAPRKPVSYWCRNLHETRRSYAVEPTVIVPDTIDCRSCGRPAGQDVTNPPQTSRSVPFKSHMAYVRERRTQAEGDALVDDALKALRGK